MLNLTEIEYWAKAHKKECKNRQLIFVELSYKQANNCFLVLGLNLQNTLFFTQDPEWQKPSNYLNKNCISPKHYRNYLGRSSQNIIYDASFGIDLNVLYGISGQVTTSGFIVVFFNTEITFVESHLAVPHSFGFEKHSDFFKTLFFNYTSHHAAVIRSTSFNILGNDKKELAELQHSQLKDDNAKKHELHNLVKQSQNKHSTAKVSSHDSPSLITLSSPNEFNRLNQLYNACSTFLNFTISKEQKYAVNCISSHLQFARNHENETLDNSEVFCILGERGRGKSTTLALILLDYLFSEKMHVSPVLVTSLNKKNLLQLHEIYNALKKVCSNLNKPIARFDELFAAPDLIAEKIPNLDLLIIDEVASLAPDIIKKLISKTKISIIAGTTTGYEGSGKGFTSLLLPFLVEQDNLRCFYLNRPFRWEKNDPVEQIFNRILCHDSTTQTEPQSIVKFEQLTFRQVEQSELIQDYKLYNEIISLLFAAHYQTTPNDIVRILNAPECKLFTVSIQQQVIGAITIFVEGSEVLQPLAGDISMNKRRVQGHLSAQGLANAIMEDELAYLNYWRVNRIAVKSSYRRQRIGSFMLKMLQNQAGKQQIDALTSSFGFRNSLFKFWTNNDFELVKIGRRIDTSSGSASVIVLRPINSAIHAYLTPLKNYVSIELTFLQAFFKRLNAVYQPLLDKNDYARPQELSELLDYSILTFMKWVKNADLEFNFDKLAPYLYFIAKTDSNLIQRLDSEFKEIVKGGLHKHQKIKIQNTIIKLVHQYIKSRFYKPNLR